MGVTLKLTENVLNTYMQWHPQVLHDLHESVPYLYDNTVGDGPYNAWIDPILADEWQMIGWNNVSEMTKFGMPGVFTHGNFDTWSPGYLMFIAALHNGISRLYETFGNGGADTVERDAAPGRVRAHLVQAESAAAEDQVVAAQQQQLRADRPADVAALLRRQRQAVPAQLLPEEQALDPEGEDRRAGRLRACRPTIRVPARRRSCCGCCRSRASRSRARPPTFTVTRARRRSRAAEPDDDDDGRAGGSARVGRIGADRVGQDGRRHAAGRRARRRRAGTRRDADDAAPSPPARTSSAWTSRTAASPMRCWTTSTGARTIRRARRTTTPAGRSPSCSTCRRCASPT